MELFSLQFFQALFKLFTKVQENFQEQCGSMLLVPLSQQLSLQLDPTRESSTSVFIFGHTTTSQTV